MPIVWLSDTKIEVGSAVDLVAVVPYVLGFHPSDGSIVVNAFWNSRVVFTARADLPDGRDAATDYGGLAAHLLTIMARLHPIDTLAFIGYGGAELVDLPLRALEHSAATAGIPVLDLVRVTDARVYSLLGSGPQWCLPDGTPYDPSTSLVAVQAIVAGLVALPGRSAVAAQLAAVKGPAADRVRHATREATVRLKALASAGPAGVDDAGRQGVSDALRRHDHGERLADDDIAWLTTLLKHEAVRDLAIGLTQPNDSHVACWLDVTRRAHEPLMPAPATVLAVTAWRCGQGALATIAAEHALATQPGYALARHIRDAIDIGLPPSAIDEMLADNDPDPQQPPAHPN